MHSNRSRTDTRSSLPPLPKYFDHLIEAYADGQAGRFVHLGYWDAEFTKRKAGPLAESPFESAQRRLNDFVLSRLPLDKGQSILDVGCGFGGTLSQINDQYAGMQLAGLNIDSRQLSICESVVPRHGNQIAWFQADACDLPFDRETFDHVICLEAMFHFSSRRGFLQEAARVMRSDGVLVVTDILLDESLFRADVPLFAIISLLQAGYGPWPEYLTTPSQWEILARQSGLNIRTRFDLSRNTAPSHEYTVPDHISEIEAPDEKELQAAMMLRWLHQRNLLRYMCYSLARS